MPVQTIYISASGLDAVTEQLRAYKSGYPGCGALVFTAEADRAEIPSIQRIFSREGIPMAGAVFPALIYGDEFVNGGFLIYLFQVSPHFIIQKDIDDRRIIPSTLHFIESVKAFIGDSEDASLMLIFDGMIPKIATILEMIYLNIEDRVLYSGANAGSETFESIPCIYDGESVSENAVLGVIFRPRIETLLEHGYRIPENLIAATSTVGNRIISIDWKPAFNVYSSLIERDYHVTITPENFYQYAVHFPFGIIRGDGEVLVRIPVRLKEDKSIFCIGEIPPNSILTLLSSGETLTEETMQKILNRFDSPPESNNILLFYCAGRRLHLGMDQAKEELRQMRKLRPGVEIAGALSLGEIGSTTSGMPLFHNATIVLSCL
jgi:hypothetical protein